MFGPDPDQQRRMAGEMDRSLEQIERESSAFFVRLVKRWALRWAIGFAVIFGLTRIVDWLDWLWWIAVPLAVLSLVVPLLFRRFLMKRLAKVRGQIGGVGGGGTTIDGSWREAEDAGKSRPSEPGTKSGGVIIDQRPRDDEPRGDDDSL